MTKIGRNDACPCGSGKKYKHCCLAQANAREQLLQEQVDAKIRAVEWLTEHYEEAIDEAVMNRFFLDEDDDAPELIAELPEHMQMAVLVCMHEWLIADADLILDEDWIRTSDLLLGPGGPLFTANGRRHIEELAASELSLYEVLEVRKDEGLLLRDMLRPGEKPVFAHRKERHGSAGTLGHLGSPSPASGRYLHARGRNLSF
ncbi:SEC-C motif domain protein (fragment) [uncultured delta proteobacterium]|uniref:SEC-C motif domain protein n=1 Tax=uncultured delta proteobacterium TaxID=34034 RepID=A0A212KH88_9DELT